MYKKNILIHIGYPKTGTSFLQEKIFKKFNNLFYTVPKYEIRKRIISPWAFGFEPEKTKVFCNDLRKEKEDVIVFSSEDLSGFPHIQDFMSRAIADRLYQSMPDAKILIVLREQRSMLKSLYFQYLKTEGSFSPEEFFISPRIKVFTKDNLKYHYLIDYYQQLFGANQVIVMPYEQFRVHSKEFIEEICRFVQVSPTEILDYLDLEEQVNVNYSPFSLRLKRYFNPFIIKNYPGAGRTFYCSFIHACWGLVNNFLKMMPTKYLDRKFEKRTEKIIDKFAKNRYKESNSLTSELIRIDLDEYGYDV